MTYSINPDSGRTDALLRIVLLLYAFTIWPIVLGIGLLAGLLYYVVDVLSQLWHNDSGANARDGTVCPWLRQVFLWPIQQLFYIIGARQYDFPVTPQRP